MKNKKLYKDLMDLPGVAGNEYQVREYLRKQFERFDVEIKQDKLGGIFAIKKGPAGSPTIMVAGHMDEVGAMVVGFNKNGTLKMKALGGLDAATFASQHMNVVTDSGAVIPGVTTTVPPHLKASGSNASNFDDLSLDVGATDDKHAKKMGIEIGDMIAPANHFTQTKNRNRIISKAVDNRWGCGMVVELLEAVHEKDLNCTLIVGANVQEEVGLRGAKVSTQMFNPDVFIALDASPAADILSGDGFGTLGEGYLLRFMDRVAIMNQGMKKWFISLSEANKTKYQYFYSPGGTDAGNAQFAHSGVLVATIGLPARYIHSTTSMFDVRDHEAAKKQIRDLVLDFSQERLDELKQNT